MVLLTAAGAAAVVEPTRSDHSSDCSANHDRSTVVAVTAPDPRDNVNFDQKQDL